MNVLVAFLFFVKRHHNLVNFWKKEFIGGLHFLESKSMSLTIIAGRMAAGRRPSWANSFTGGWLGGQHRERCWLLLPQSLPTGIHLLHKAMPPWAILGPFLFKPPKCRMVLHEKHLASGLKPRYNHFPNFSVYISVILYTYVNAYIHHPDLSVLDNLHWILIKKDEFITRILPSILQNPI